MARRLILSFCVLGLIASAVFAESHERGVVGYRDFFYPTYHGTRLSYCTADKSVCGMEVASKFCQIMGYEKATKVRVEHNVGLTRFPGSKLQCQGWKCDGFKWITCVEGLEKKPTPMSYYRLRDFESPRFENYRVAWCYKNNKGCGQRAATAFCRHLGYRRAKSYEKDMKVVATRDIGDGNLCFGENCTGFGRITCFR